MFWRGEMWRESFERGAFDGIEDHAGRVRVNREHVKGDTVGKVVDVRPAAQRRTARPRQDRHDPAR